MEETNSTIKDKKSISLVESLYFFIYKYISLARLTSPAPIFLLIFPGFWSIALNSTITDSVSLINVLYLYGAFLLGGVLTRSVGCIINDIADRKIDSLVERTKTRMLASNSVSIYGAIIFAVMLSIGAIAILLTLNKFTIFLGVVSGVLTVIYPFSKRFTNYPQVILGITFAFGVLMGGAALHEHFTLPTIFLYVVCVLWIIGFDSIYAIQDYKDDKILKIKSTVVTFNENIQSFVGYLYFSALILLFVIGYLIGASLIFYLICLLVMFHFIWQVVNININRPDVARRLFKYNAYVGLLLWIAFLVG